MWLAFVIALKPSGDFPEHGFSIRQGIDANIVAFKGFEKGFCHAILKGSGL